MKTRDRPVAPRARAAGARNVKLGAGGIREIEFLVQALQLLYGGDDPWLRERNSLRALFRLTERGYLSPGARPHARARARASAHGRAPPAAPPRAPDAHAARRSRRRSGCLARRMGIAAAAGRRARGASCAEHRAHHRAACTAAFREFFASAAGRRRTARSASRATPRSRPPASPIPSARARTSGSSWRAGPLVPYPRRRAGALDRHLPRAARRALADARSRRGAQPVRALRRRRRGRAPRYLELLADAPRSARRTWSGSARAASC